MVLLGYSCPIALFNCWNSEGLNTVSKNGGMGSISALQAKLSISSSGFVEMVMMLITCVESTHICHILAVIFFSSREKRLYRVVVRDQETMYCLICQNFFHELAFN